MDNCRSSYPLCLFLILGSCCGHLGICIDNIFDMESEICSEKENDKIYCIRDPVSNGIFELPTNNISLYTFSSYEIYDPDTIQSCEDLGCQEKNLECVYETNTCETESPCCRPKAKCIDTMKQDQSIASSLDHCTLKCTDGFICRWFIGSPEVCLPVTCDSNKFMCPEGTSCQPVPGVGAVSCFPTLEISESDLDNTCDEIDCLPNFHCAPGAFTNSDCVPDGIRAIAQKFDCTLCPKGWTCDSFGSSGICVEWFSDPPHYGHECVNERCLATQYCNYISGQCEYHICNSTICGDGMICLQSNPRQPRICVTDLIYPFTAFLSFDLVTF
ncbi:hypothetical protein DLAC_11652 [Tieghemostelium lacteum]|uniref:DSCP-N domain-containing protein n=1 Tax=Tieghemostelium lacteum TaxID=361077 RepID=A0A151ZES6_TIELA|nr:hypothetical protein DLAC_11652 [Tieghemostelium lacteum]|eukprot:KYQ92461.1 hypothetical protein DLAC_11652 [Tieghemostelium lacteum]